MNINVTFDNIALDDPIKDRQTIRNNFMKELCELDKDATINGKSNIFTIKQIQEKCLGAFSLSYVKDEILKFSKENDPDIEFIDGEKNDKIRLTIKGRNFYCNKTSQYKKIFLLLGAGASVFIDKPTTKEFKTRFIKKYENYTKNKPNSQEIQSFKTLIGLLKFPDFEDIEYLFQFLTDLNKIDLFQILPSKNIANIYLKAQLKLYVEDGSITYHEFIPFLKAIPNLLDILDYEVYDCYRLSGLPKENELIKNIYLNNLLPFLKKYNDNKIIISTTNYDKVIEEIIELDYDNYNLINGFKSRRQKMIFNNKNFDDIQKDKINIILLKLHGSLDWKLTNNEEIIITTEEKNNLPYIKKHLLITPTLFIKETCTEPFLSIHNRFNEYIKNFDILVIIGFSFRDEYLVDYIKKNGLNKILIVIDPNPFDALRKFLDIKEQLKCLKIHGNIIFSHHDKNFKVVLIQEKFNESTINKILQKLEYVIDNNSKEFWRVTKVVSL